MIDFLLGVPGKLKTISDYLTTNWTTTRAAKLDYLTAGVAVASTAVSNANYTSGRAAKLDLIAADQTAKPPVSVNTHSNNVTQGTLGTLPGFLHSIGITSASLVDVVNITNSGVLEFCAAGSANNTNGQTIRLVLTIDGTVVLDQTATSDGTQYGTVVAVGVMSNASPPVVVALGSLPFNTSLRIQRACSASQAVAALTKYRLTA